MQTVFVNVVHPPLSNETDGFAFVFFIVWDVGKWGSDAAANTSIHVLIYNPNLGLSTNFV